MDYRPWTWKVPENSSDMSRKITRQDAFERVSGQAVFTRDVVLPGMLYAKILLSPYAHARIKSIDTSEAAALFGVRDILKYDDPDIEFDNETLPGFEVSRNYNLLTLPRTSEFYQHPMGVVVVADTEEICDRALRLLAWCADLLPQTGTARAEFRPNRTRPDCRRSTPAIDRPPSRSRPRNSPRRHAPMRAARPDQGTRSAFSSPGKPDGRTR